MITLVSSLKQHLRKNMQHSVKFELISGLAHILGECLLAVSFISSSQNYIIIALNYFNEKLTSYFSGFARKTQQVQA